MSLVLIGCNPHSTLDLQFVASPVPSLATPVAPATSPPRLPGTVTPTEPPKPYKTITPLPSAQSHIYFFPVQPVENTSFAPGVSSHGYPAIDIFAPRGAEFVAVTDGMVDFVSNKDSWDPITDDPSLRGGLAIAIIGDDGIRYYGSHLSEVEDGIEPGVRVEAGQLLGRIGDSGNARGKDPHLHFGISQPTYPGDWKARRGEIDPYPYLEAWMIGILISPELALPRPTRTRGAPGSR